MRPSGTFSRKIQRHDACVAMSPPSGGPITGAMSPGQVMVPMASISRCFGVSRSTTSRPTGDMKAAAAPCSTRAATNTSKVGASPQASEAMVKVPTASANTRRAPKRPAHQPAAGTSAAIAIR